MTSSIPGALRAHRPARLTSQDIPHLLALLPAAVFVFAATSKLIEPAPIKEALQWLLPLAETSLASRLIVAAAAGLLIATEALLGVALALRIAPRRAARLTIALLAGFTIYLLVAAFSLTAPPCGCLGSWGPSVLVQEGPTIGVLRNLVLITLLMPLARMR